MSIFSFFKKKEKESVSSSAQTDQDRRTYLINGEWVHVSNCMDDTLWTEANESELHTPCWYPIQLCQLTNKSVNLYPCSSVEDATNRIQSFIRLLKS